jgi:hypothetical protein
MHEREVFGRNLSSPIYLDTVLAFQPSGNSQVRHMNERYLICDPNR